MELKGIQHIQRKQADVWAALNDPAILQRCIPGCESFEPAGENTYQILMSATVGPVKAKFKGKLVLADVVSPSSYSMTFEGSGGAAGFGKGAARVSLAPSPSGTDLSYSTQAQVGGKLAQVGSRLIDSVAGKMAEEFFSRFKAAVEPAKEQQADLDESTSDLLMVHRYGKKYLWGVLGLALLLIVFGLIWSTAK